MSRAMGNDDPSSARKSDTSSSDAHDLVSSPGTSCNIAARHSI